MDSRVTFGILKIEKYCPGLKNSVPLEPGLSVTGTVRQTLAMSLVAILTILEEQEFVPSGAELPTTENSREEQLTSQVFITQ